MFDPQANKDTSISDETQPWDKLPGESTRAYAAFLLYLNLAPNSRSIARAYRAKGGRTGEEQGRSRGGRAPSHWEAWASSFDWITRANAWDAHLLRESLRKAEIDHEQQIREYHERERQLAIVQQRLALQIHLRLHRVLESLPPVERDANGYLDVNRLLPPALIRAMHGATIIAAASAETEARLLGVDAILMYVTDSPSLGRS